MPRTLQFKGPNTGFLNTPNLTQGFRVQASLDGGSSRVVIKSRVVWMGIQDTDCTLLVQNKRF